MLPRLRFAHLNWPRDSAARPPWVEEREGERRDEREREREREREKERGRKTDKQTNRQTEREREAFSSHIGGYFAEYAVDDLVEVRERIDDLCVRLLLT